MRAPILEGAERVRVRQEMRSAYEQEHLTIHQVAARFGRSYGNTHALLREAGTTIRYDTVIPMKPEVSDGG